MPNCAQLISLVRSVLALTNKAKAVASDWAQAHFCMPLKMLLIPAKPPAADQDRERSHLGLSLSTAGEVSQRQALLTCILCSLQSTVCTVLPRPFGLEELPPLWGICICCFFCVERRPPPSPSPTSESP